MAGTFSRNSKKLSSPVTLGSAHTKHVGAGDNSRNQGSQLESELELEVELNLEPEEELLLTLSPNNELGL